MTIESAVFHLLSTGVVDRRVFGQELLAYVEDRRPYDDLGKLVSLAFTQLRVGMHFSISELLAAIGVNYTHGNDRSEVSKHIGLMHPDQIPVAPWATDLRRFVRRKSALVAPVYISRAAPSALFVVNAKGESAVFPISELDSGHFVGLRGVPGSDVVVLVSTPAHAISANVSGALSRLGSIRLIAPVPFDAAPERITAAGDTRIVVWHPCPISAFAWARKQVNGLVSDTPVDLASNPTLVPRQLHHVASTAREPFEVIAEHLTGLPADAALSVYRRLDIPDSEAHTIINRAPVAARKALADLLTGEASATQVEVGGRIISVGADSWHTGGARITNFGMTLLETWAENGQIIVRGEVRTAGRVLQFEEPIETIRSGTLRWLERFVISNGGDLPIVARGWGSRLFEISTAIRPPDTRATGDLVHWDGRRLILPTFIINADGTTAYNTAIDTSAAASCAISQPPDPFSAKDLGRLTDEAMLWTVLLHIATAVTRSIHGFASPGLVITGPGRMGWHRALRDKLGLASTTTAYPTGAIRREARSVFPVIVEVASDATYREWVNKDGHNAILVTDRSGARLLRSRGWAYVNATTEPSPAHLAMLPHVITLVRAALARDFPDGAGNTVYSSIARAMSQEYPEMRCAGLGTAMSTLSAYAWSAASPDADANRIIASVRDLVAIGDLVVETRFDGYVFEWDAYTAAMDSHGIVPGMLTAATRALVSAKRGGAAGSTRVRIDRMAWRGADLLALAH